MQSVIGSTINHQVSSQQQCRVNILDDVFEKLADQPPRAASVLLGYP
jgi:hypothetical protein